MSTNNDSSNGSIDCDDISVPSADDVSQLVDVLDGVGVKRARALTLAGIDSIACLATVDPSVVAQLPSFGSETAQSVVDQACMHEQDEAVSEPVSDTDSDVESVVDDSGIPEYDTDTFRAEVEELNEVALDIYDKPLPGFQSSESEIDMTPDEDFLQVAVAAHNEYGKEMKNKDAVQYVLTAIKNSPIRTEEIDQVVYVHQDEESHGGNHIYNAIHYDWNKGFTSSSMSEENIEEAMIELNPIKTPWDDVTWNRDNTSAHLSGSDIRPSADNPYGASKYDDFVDMVRDYVDIDYDDDVPLEEIVNGLIVMNPELDLDDIEDSLDYFDITDDDARLEKKKTKLGESEETRDGFLAAYDADNRGNRAEYQELTKNGKNKKAPQQRNRKMADVADCLLVVDDGRDFAQPGDDTESMSGYSPFLSSMKGAFRSENKTVINYSDYREAEEMFGDVDLPELSNTL